jgi:hypothetical protein
LAHITAMPDRPRKRPRDPNQPAKFIVDIATGRSRIASLLLNGRKTPLRSRWAGLAASRARVFGLRTLAPLSENRLRARLPLCDGRRRKSRSRQLVSATFDRFARKFGGAYYPSANTDPAFTQFVTFMRQSRHRALLHVQAFSSQAATYRLENGWIWDGRFNALADIEEVDEIDCIGINVGTAYILCNLFRAMLSHPEILKRVGNSRQETTRVPHNPETLAIDLTNLHPLELPKDARRARYSFQLSYCAFHFIFLHEFAHLFHGHVDWLYRNVGFRGLGEIGGSSIPGLKPTDLQTIEMDADAFGITDLLMAALGISYPDRSRPPVIPETYVFGTRANAIFTVMTMRLYLKRTILRPSIGNVLRLDRFSNSSKTLTLFRCQISGVS